MNNTAATTAPRVTYTVSVTPTFDGLASRYAVTLYSNVRAGVCGPFSEDVTVNTLAEVDQQLFVWGFNRTGEFGPVCANGFADAPVVPFT